MYALPRLHQTVTEIRVLIQDVLLAAKAEAIKNGQGSEELLAKALEAFSRYAGREDDNDDVY